MTQTKELGSLDELIAKLSNNDTGAQTEGTSELLLEHLRAARRDLLGSMPGEYGLGLEQAMRSISSIGDKGDRMETKTALQNLIDAGNPRKDGQSSRGKQFASGGS